MTKAHLPSQPPVLPSSPGTDRKGLLWILDEEVLVPGSGDSAAFDRLCSYFATKGPDQEGKSGSAQLPTLWHRHSALEIQEIMQQIKSLPGLFFWGAVTGDGYMRRCEQALHFEICHQLGTDPVRYDLTGWLSKAKLNLSAENAIQVLQQSKV